MRGSQAKHFGNFPKYTHRHSYLKKYFEFKASRVSNCASLMNQNFPIHFLASGRKDHFLYYKKRYFTSLFITKYTIFSYM